MKLSLLIMNAGILLFLISISFVFHLNPNTGQKVALFSGLILSIGFVLAFIQNVKTKKLFHQDTLIITLSAITGSIILFEAFSNSLDFSVISVFPKFFLIHRIGGFIILVIFGYLGWKSINKLEKDWKSVVLKIAFIIFLILTFLGIASFARIIPVPVKMVYYGWLIFLFTIIGWTILNFSDKSSSKKSKEDKIVLLIGVSLLLYWIFRWNINSDTPNDFLRFVFVAL